MNDTKFRLLIGTDSMAQEEMRKAIMSMAEVMANEFGRPTRVTNPSLTDAQAMAAVYLDRVDLVNKP